VSTELDLRGVKCPLSWAKARVRLETLARGQELTLVLDDPQGAHDIPRAPKPRASRGRGRARRRALADHDRGVGSRRTAAGRLSVRRPRNTGWRMRSSSVHSVKRTSQTSSGRTQWFSPVARRLAAPEGTPGDDERTEPVVEVLQAAGVEAGADATRVDERVALVDTHVQRAEVRPRALRRGVPADHELLAAVTLDLEPLLPPAPRYGESARLATTPSRPASRATVKKSSPSPST